MKTIKSIDITQPMDAFVFPGNPAMQVSGPHNRVSGNNPEFVYDLTMCSQTGTHIQGGHYFLENGKKIDQYPLASFQGKAFLVDCRKVVGDIGIDFCRQFFAALPLANNILILRTDYFDKLLKDPAARIARIGLSLEAAKYLCEKKKIKMIGIDSIGLESRVTRNFEVNKYLCTKNILMLEGLVNLRKIKKKVFYLSAYPLKISGVEGTPCRAVVTGY